MTRDNARIYMILTYHMRKGVPLDKQELLDAFAVLARRATLDPFTLASLGYFVMNDLSEPDAAIPYFIQAIETTPPNDPFPWQLGNELRAKGRTDLAEKIERIGQTKRSVRSEEHTSELQSLMRNSYAVVCLNKKNTEVLK